MSIKNPASLSASPIISRRLFSKRALGALAGAASLSVVGHAAAQDVIDESLPASPRPEPSSSVAVEDPVVTVGGGQFVANFALSYVGYGYVWGGNSPAGFDCSGFTQFVILNSLGIDIGHSSHGQPGYGAWVDAGNLQPGDLVFFAGTFGPGVTHTGVYIGGGQFVHAENEGTGVTVSALWSDYYAAHYYGATRLW